MWCRSLMYRKLGLSVFCSILIRIYLSFIITVDMEDFLGEAKEVIPTLRGVKYSSTDLMDATQCVYMENQRFDIVTGVDEVYLL